ncbi:transposase [Rhizobium sp. BK591]|nr:transposase [Rhizobium sp. BK591]
MHQNLPSVLRCRIAAFEAIGGAPREVLYDWMKTAVIGEGQTEGIVYNRASLTWLVTWIPSQSMQALSGQDKRQGRAAVPLYSDFFLARSFRNLDDLNAQLRHWLDIVANARKHDTSRHQRTIIFS